MRGRRTSLIVVILASLTLVATAATVQKITGTVANSLGEPVQGIEVSFFDATTAELIATTASHGTGAYDSGHIPIGSYRLRFSDPALVLQPQFLGTAGENGGGYDFFCEGTTVPVAASTTTIVDVQLGPFEPIEIAGFDGPVTGVVVDAATGAPLQGIRVSLLKSWNAGLIATSVTDADGIYSFDPKTMPDLSFIPAMRIRFSDPAGNFFSEFYGAGSDNFCNAPIVMEPAKSFDGFLDRVPVEQLTQQLADAVQSYDLPANVATLLGTPLTQARKFLAEGRQAAGCAQLASFVTRVDTLEQRGELSMAEANELRSQAGNVRSLVCQ